ncbi:MAG: yaiO [Segetibacter sp.]|nr:yaiO [Segetibacter sp.]
MNIRTLILIGLLPISALLKAQTPASSDELFKAARNASFEEKDDNKAKQLAKQALLQSPQYADVQVFLGRLYTWNKQYDTAVYEFLQVLTYAPSNEDASIAYTDLEYWNEHYDKALTVCSNGLSANPTSAGLLLRKAKILNALKQYKEAAQITDQLLRSNKHNTAAWALASTLKDAASVNKIGISYDYSHFDKQFAQPWQLASIGYSRHTTIGSFSANVNYAKRFGSNGWQGEVEAYPRISKTFYSYVSAGYSPGETVFPKYRAGFSLYANLPRSYEAEAGIRYLNFGSSTYVYTLYIGKYYSNFLFGARTYVTPGTAGASQSYSLLGRYYFKSADDYIGVSIGSGISPDERALSIQYNNKNRFSSRQASVSFNHSIAKMNIISLKAGWLNQEYKIGETGNQVDVSIGLQRRF